VQDIKTHDESQMDVEQNFDQSLTNVGRTKVGHCRCDGGVIARNATIAMALWRCYYGAATIVRNDGAAALLLQLAIVVLRL